MHLSVRRFGQAVAALIALLCAHVAAAHEMRPAIASLSFAEDGSAAVFAINTNLEAIVAGIGPEHEDTDDSPLASVYDQLRALPPAELEAAFREAAPGFLADVTVMADGARAPLEVTGLAIPAVGDLEIARDGVVEITAALPEGATEITFEWAPRLGEIVLRGGGGETGEGVNVFLKGGETSDPIAVEGATTDALTAFIDYIWVGFEHIIPLGLDHILFVIGLYLLSTRLGPLLWQITAFTAAHTVTLALGSLGIINLPGSIVEPIIAASIVYVAVENMMTDRLHRWRTVIVFLFGLLHGLGFAGVLAEFGLAPGQFVVSLIAFNIGVEFGQLAVVAICFLAFGYWFGDKPWYRKVIVIPLSLVIAVIGAYWVIERTLL